jgi:hypothetical protein
MYELSCIAIFVILIIEIVRLVVDYDLMGKIRRLFK